MRLKALGTMIALTALLTAAVGVGSAWAQAAQAVELGVITRPGSAQNIAADKFRELVEIGTAKRIKVTVHHSGSLGDEAEILAQLKSGQIQMAIVSFDPWIAIAPQVGVVKFPFLFRDEQQVDEVLSGETGRLILDSLESVGFQGLAFTENGFRHLTNSLRPVKAADDVTGLKIRVMDSPLDQAAWEALGATTFPLPWPIKTALEDGVVDGQENPLWVDEIYQLYEVQRFLSLTRHIYSGHIAAANLSWWRGLTEADRQALGQAMTQAAEYQRRVIREHNGYRLAFLKTKGMVVEEQPDWASFRTKMASLKDNPAYQAPEVKALLDRILTQTEPPAPEPTEATTGQTESGQGQTQPGQPGQTETGQQSTDQGQAEKPPAGE